MSIEPLIQANEISGGSVYGVKQYEYTVDGVSGQDYTAAIAVASLREAVAIEHSASAYSDVVKLRQEKVEALSEVLAILAKAIAQIDTSNNNTDAESGNIPELKTAKSICESYGLTLTIKEKDGKTTITYRNASTAQNDIEYAMDTEDNNLSQDMVSLQSLISKRDNAYSTASSIVQKADSTASDTIANIS
jgi:deferrochelatase/peroxidase EfeB